LFKDIGCVSLHVEDALSYNAANDEMIRCMKSLKRTNQKKHRPKLKKTKSKVDRLNEKLTKRMSTSKSHRRECIGKVKSVLVGGIDE